MKIFGHSEVIEEMIILKTNAWQVAQKKTYSISPRADTFFGSPRGTKHDMDF